MKKVVGLLLVVLMVMAFNANFAAAATNPPNLVGTWTGTVKTVKPGKYEEYQVTVKITSQRGFRFKGTSQSPGNQPEKIVGVIYDGQIYATESGSTIVGKLFFYPKKRMEGVFQDSTGTIETGVWSLTKTGP
ncbi:MAG: hypothetical protein JRI57_08900 [Deltaproteobacteria bacterium]|nr:hypothetical protein [Deltaproteobacteria bacterium]MBW1952408.1 hypothetical protein [Deltaproteobacteria bacterium]